VKSHLRDLHDERQDLLRLDPLELELRYTDWVAKVKVVLAEIPFVADAGIEIIEMEKRFLVAATHGADRRGT
jgi:hypothetical protein